MAIVPGVKIEARDAEPTEPTPRVVGQLGIIPEGNKITAQAHGHIETGLHEKLSGAQPDELDAPIPEAMGTYPREVSWTEVQRLDYDLDTGRVGIMAALPIEDPEVVGWDETAPDPGERIAANAEVSVGAKGQVAVQPAGRVKRSKHKTSAHPYLSRKDMSRR